MKNLSIFNLKFFFSIKNSFWCFVQDFSKIAILFILILKKIELLDSALKVFRTNNNKFVEGINRANKTIVNLFKNNKFRNLTYITNIEAIKKSILLTLITKKIFNY